VVLAQDVRSQQHGQGSHDLDPVLASGPDSDAAVGTGRRRFVVSPQRVAPAAVLLVPAGQDATILQASPEYEGLVLRAAFPVSE
jgi:hypothetical protein